jgi:hypothetical protein
MDYFEVPGDVLEPREFREMIRSEAWKIIEVMK